MVLTEFVGTRYGRGQRLAGNQRAPDERSSLIRGDDWGFIVPQFS